jgi:mTERF domain-containing protein
MLTYFFLILWQADSGTDGSFNLKVVPPALLAAEKEEAKAVLTFFLKKQGPSNSVAARTINKSDLFIDHLVSRLHSVHKSRYLVGSISIYYLLLLLRATVNLLYFILKGILANQVPLGMAGRELTTLEIRDALNPYLEALLKEHGNFMVDVAENSSASFSAQFNP